MIFVWALSFISFGAIVGYLCGYMDRSARALRELKESERVHLTGYCLDEQQKAQLDEWMSKKDLTRGAGAIGGRFTYQFTQTTLGLVVKVLDGLDGTHIDLSDYKSW